MVAFTNIALTDEQRSYIGMHSELIARKVETEQDALKHHELLVLIRAKQAEATSALLPKQKQQASPELIAARNAWKKAVEDRRQAILQWDNYVKYLHDEFTKVRTRGA